jgi:DNA-directed RNA polymerase specialized sigma subunit
VRGIQRGYKMDKRELSQLKHLNIEIDTLREQIERAEFKVTETTTSDMVKGSSKYFPYSERHFTITGIDTRAYEKKVRALKRKLKRRLDELMDKLDEINEYISTIPDSEIRLILSLRYINGLSWQQIAAHMGMEGDGSTERKKHDRFLKYS